MRTDREDERTGAAPGPMPSGEARPGQPGARFFGWRVVAAAFVNAVLAWGVSFYGPPIFLHVLHRTHGWPIATISAAISMQFLVGAVVVAKLASLHARFGVASVTRTGGLLTAVALLGWAFSGAVWHLFVVAAVGGTGWAMTSGAALNAMVSPWFDRKRPAALGMAYNGASLGGLVFAPLWVALIARLGFRAAALVVAALVAAVLAWLAHRYLRLRPADLGLRPDGDGRAQLEPGRAAASARVGAPPAPLSDAPWRDPRLLALAAGATLCLFAQVGLFAHLFSLIAPALGVRGAGIVLGATAGSAIVGRTLVGALMPAGADRTRVLAANVAMQAAGSLLLACSDASLALLLAGCALFGLGVGNVTSMPALIAQRRFSPADVPQVVALCAAVSQGSCAFAPLAFAGLRSLPAAGDSSSASAALVFAAAALVQALAVLVLARRWT